MIKVSPFVCSVEPSPRSVLDPPLCLCRVLGNASWFLWGCLFTPQTPALSKPLLQVQLAFLLPLPSSIHRWLNMRKWKWCLLSFKHRLLKANMKLLLLFGGVSCFPVPLLFNCWRLGVGFFCLFGFFSWYLISKLDLQLKNRHKLVGNLPWPPVVVHK